MRFQDPIDATSTTMCTKVCRGASSGKCLPAVTVLFPHPSNFKIQCSQPRNPFVVEPAANVFVRAGRYIDTVLVTYCIPNSELKYNLSFRVVAAPVQHCELQVGTWRGGGGCLS